MKTKILDFDIYSAGKEEFLQYIFHTEGKKVIISGNPEILYNGVCNKELKEGFLLKRSIIIPDGIGTVLASKLVRQPVEEKIAGIEVMQEILNYCNKEGKSVYLLGARQETLDSCIKNIKFQYKGIDITGSHHGFFDINSCDSIIEDIKSKEPFVLFVAMGCPKQDLFINRYFNELPCKLFMGVGGSFDVFAGKVKRAPIWMIKLGIEWLYRVSKEPSRIARLTSIPKFLFKVVYNTYIVKR